MLSLLVSLTAVTTARAVISVDKRENIIAHRLAGTWTSLKGPAITAVLTDEPDVLAYVDTSSIEEEELPVFIAGNL